jgi:hypothetical protein
MVSAPFFSCINYTSRLFFTSGRLFTGTKSTSFLSFERDDSGFRVEHTGFHEKAALHRMSAVIQRNAYYSAGISHTIPVGMWSGVEQR